MFLRRRAFAAEPPSIIRKARNLSPEPPVVNDQASRKPLPDLGSKRGASLFKMMDVSRHPSVDTLRGYVRNAELFQDHAGAGLL